MAGIYEPKGAAREYSPLALNYIKGCDHNCLYCYVPKLMQRFDSGYVHSNVYAKEESELLIEIERSAKKHKNSDRQVFLSFLTDPYSSFNKETKLTRRVLEILFEYKIPVSILTKGGMNVMDDIDIILKFGKNIQVGASLTFTKKENSMKWESGAALPEERFLALKKLHELGMKTWASLEPVIFPDESLEIMEITSEYVDYFKIGKLNHFPRHEDKFDWTKFLSDSVSIMRKNGKSFYVKKDLLAYKNPNLILSNDETDMDFHALKNTFN